MNPSVQGQQAAEEVGLVYVHDNVPGITRKHAGDGFVYLSPAGKPIDDEAVLQRIHSLAIPPAYRDVWISPDPNGHLQATGKDARGRKQYRYHPRFREARDENKFGKMALFARALPSIHDRLAVDFGKKGLPREKVLSAVVLLLEKSLIRVGNEEYRKQNHSYGLTTLRSNQVDIEGSEICFHFLGKSKVQHRIALHDRKLAAVVRKIQDLPGQELFQYLDEKGARHSVTSHDVNAYLHSVAGESFTAKDFRTWAGTLLAVAELAQCPMGGSIRAQKAAVMHAMKSVASQLGNTPAICRKSYVHPAVIEAYIDGSLASMTQAGIAKAERDGRQPADVCWEEAVLQLLDRSGQQPAA